MNITLEHTDAGDSIRKNMGETMFHMMMVQMVQKTSEPSFREFFIKKYKNTEE